MVKIGSKYLDSRAEQNYNAHDEMQMIVIIDKIVDELKNRYGNKTEFIQNRNLRMLIEHW